MSGFSFSLKTNKVTKDNKKKLGVTGIRKITSKSVGKKSTVFGEQNDGSSHSKTLIDGFHATDGAMSGTIAVSKPRVLVIEPINKTHTLVKKSSAVVASTDEPSGSSPQIEDNSQLSIEERARRSILNGENYVEVGSKIITGTTEDDMAETVADDYESVPVDQFGAALLRGMGWNGESEPQKSTKVHSRQQGAVLGIGAEAIEKDLEAELLCKKNLSVPLIRRSEQ